MGHRTWDKSDQTGLIWNLPSNELGKSQWREMRKIQGMSRRDKNKNLCLTPIITTETLEKRRETGEEEKKGRDRTRRNP